ncbi:MAG: DUF58 domain-containing protein [Cyanobacteria bacterium HKST-UBA04]|nr:DUF58 domain-containing protein [Cyanobacteria bacterium HKST-UBA04]
MATKEKSVAPLLAPLPARYRPTARVGGLLVVLGILGVLAMVWPMVALLWLSVVVIAMLALLAEVYQLRQCRVQLLSATTNHHPTVHVPFKLTLCLSVMQAGSRPVLVADGPGDETRMTARFMAVAHDVFRLVEEAPPILCPLAEAGRPGEGQHAANDPPATHQVVLHLNPARRGRWWWPGGYVACQTFLGLLRAYKPVPPVALSVYPAMVNAQTVYLNPDLLRLQTGVKQNRRYKADQEFESLRPYQPGDEYRYIDWKASARLNGLITRQFQVAHHHQILVCLDKSRMMGTLSEGVRKIDWSIQAVLHLGMLAKRYDDRLGLVVFDEAIAQFSKPRPASVPRLLEQLVDVDCSLVEPNYPLLCTSILQTQRKRSLVIILSDFMDASSLEPSLPAFEQLNRRHCTLFIGVDDPVYHHYLHHPSLDTPDAVVKHILAVEARQRRDRVIHQLRHRGLHALTATPQTLTEEAMKAYSTIKLEGAIG